MDCRRRDEERAKKEGLAQSIACRRKIVDASGVLVNCHGEHLSNHCDRAPKVNLARLHPMHPFPLQENSPVESLNDWVHFTSGLKEYEGHPPCDDVILPAESRDGPLNIGITHVFMPKMYLIAGTSSAMVLLTTKSLHISKYSTKNQIWISSFHLVPFVQFMTITRTLMPSWDAKDLFWESVIVIQISATKY